MRREFTLITFSFCFLGGRVRWVVRLRRAERAGPESRAIQGASRPDISKTDRERVVFLYIMSVRIAMTHKILFPHIYYTHERNVSVLFLSALVVGFPPNVVSFALVISSESQWPDTYAGHNRPNSWIHPEAVWFSPAHFPNGFWDIVSASVSNRSWKRRLLSGETFFVWESP